MSNEQTMQLLNELGQSWAAAELRSDADALQELLTDDFACVGPFGFVLNKAQFVGARRSGDLKNSGFEWSDVETRLYGDAAVAIGIQTQQSTYQGNDASGRLRVTQVMVRQGDRWKIASLHYSPIAPPPQQ